MGPDGAIYIADWYNPIIQHGEVDFRDPRRDVTHGRIWRVTAKGRPLVKKPKIEGATTAELLEALKLPEQWTRDMARRSLIEKGLSEVSKELKIDSIEPHSGNPDEPNYYSKLQYILEIARVLVETEVSRTAKGLEKPDRDFRNFLLQHLSEHQDSRIRIGELTLIRSLAEWNEPNIHPEVFVKVFSQLMKDSSPQARLHMVRVFGFCNTPDAVKYAMQVFEYPMDRFLDYALWLTVRELEPQWLPAFRDGKLKFDDPKHLLFAVQASESPELVEPLLKYLQQNDLKGETADALWNQVALLGGPKELQILWKQCLDTKLSDDQRLKRLQALEVAASVRKVKPAGELESTLKLIDSKNEEIACSAIRLTGYWKVEKLLSSNFDASKSSIQMQIAFCQALGQFPMTPGLSISLKYLASPGFNRRVNMEAIKQLMPHNYMWQKFLIEFMQNATEAELNHLLPTLLQRKNGTQDFAKALENATLSADVAKITQRIARSTGQVHQPLIDALAKAGKLSAAKWEATPVVMKDLLEGIAKEGNAARGELIYRRKELNCLKCHGIGGSGGQIGPDMTSIGASSA